MLEMAPVLHLAVVFNNVTHIVCTRWALLQRLSVLYVQKFREVLHGHDLTRRTLGCSESHPSLTFLFARKRCADIEDLGVLCEWFTILQQGLDIQQECVNSLGNFRVTSHLRQKRKSLFGIQDGCVSILVFQLYWASQVESGLLQDHCKPFSNGVPQILGFCYDFVLNRHRHTCQAVFPSSKGSGMPLRIVEDIGPVLVCPLLEPTRLSRELGARPLAPKTIYVHGARV